MFGALVFLLMGRFVSCPQLSVRFMKLQLCAEITQLPRTKVPLLPGFHQHQELKKKKPFFG